MLSSRLGGGRTFSVKTILQVNHSFKIFPDFVFGVEFSNVEINPLNLTLFSDSSLF